VHQVPDAGVRHVHARHAVVVDVAHDQHHIRQLNNLRYAYLAANSTMPLDYAGPW
jgi:hypothetical protein